MCTNCSIAIDQTKKDQFSERLVDILNSSALGVMLSIGYRTGLLDTLGDLEPSTSTEIAKSAGLNERYVREWLAAMVTGGIVQYQPEEKAYFMPPEHTAWLTRKNTPNNIAVTTQWIPLMAQVEDRIVESFHTGGGLQYSEYHRFNEIMADESLQTVVTPLIDSLLPIVDGLEEKLEKGIKVLDVGCGVGKALLALAQAFPNSEFTGYDFLDSAVQKATAEAKESNLSNISFFQKDAAEFEDSGKYDLVFTFDAVHDQAKPMQMLQNIFNSLKPDGIYFCQDIAGSSHLENNLEHPLAPLMYSLSTTHCMSVSLAQDGAGLGTMWGRELATQMMKEAGFSSVEITELEHDIINYYYIARK